MWTYYQPVRVVWGEGVVRELGEHMETAGYERAVLFTTDSLMNNGLARRVRELAGGRIVAMSAEVEPNPSIQNVDAGAALARSLGADCIVALGGGSAMDCAKAVAACVAEGLDAAALLAGPPAATALPIIAIPTTAGTGSEVTAGAVISNKERGVKLAIFSPEIFPKLALVDPELTYTVPARVTAATGLDVLAHALDATTSVKANAATDALAVSAAKLVVANLERAVANGADKDARAGMSQASTIAGLAFSQTGTTGSHACSYILTSRFGVPHGEACAFTLDAWFSINAQVRPQLNGYARELGFEDAQALCGWLGGLKERLGMRTRLSQIGAGEADIPEIVASSMASGNMANNIAQIGEAGVSDLFRKLL